MSYSDLECVKGEQIVFMLTIQSVLFYFLMCLSLFAKKCQVKPTLLTMHDIQSKCKQ